jgi:polyisoprenoid-binding protein YceI
MIAAGPRRTLLVISLAMAALCPSARASIWELDPSATRIAFSVKNLSVARVEGTFRLLLGRVAMDDEDPSRSRVEALIDAASVDTSEPKRDAHLRSADFLDVARYPTIAFRST